MLKAFHIDPLSVELYAFQFQAFPLLVSCGAP